MNHDAMLLAILMAGLLNLGVWIPLNIAQITQQYITTTRSFLVVLVGSNLLVGIVTYALVK